MIRFPKQIITRKKGKGKGKSMNMVSVGIDFAKNVFAVHGVDEKGLAILIKPRVVRAIAGTDRRPAALPDRNGSLYRCLPLGQTVPSARLHRQANGTQVRGFSPHDRTARQERCSGCRCHRRSRHPASLAFRPDQKHRPAKPAVPVQHPTKASSKNAPPSTTAFVASSPSLASCCHMRQFTVQTDFANHLNLLDF